MYKTAVIPELFFTIRPKLNSTKIEIYKLLEIDLAEGLADIVRKGGGRVDGQSGRLADVEVLI